MRYKKIVFKLFIGLFFISLVSNSIRAGEPGVTGKKIMDYIERGLNILKDPSLSGPEKLEDRKLKLWGEISPIFNFNEMSKRSLGRYWNERNVQEQNEFANLFTVVLKEGYIGKTDSYSGEKLVYLREITDDKHSKVQTKLVMNTGNEAFIDFKLFNNNGNWEIYDVIIEGVSLVGNYRSQFNSVLVKSSFSDLIEILKEKAGKG